MIINILLVIAVILFLAAAFPRLAIRSYREIDPLAFGLMFVALAGLAFNGAFS